MRDGLTELVGLDTVAVELHLVLPPSPAGTALVVEGVAGSDVELRHSRSVRLSLDF